MVYELSELWEFVLDKFLFLLASSFSFPQHETPAEIPVSSGPLSQYSDSQREGRGVFYVDYYSNKL